MSNRDEQTLKRAPKNFRNDAGDATLVTEPVIGIVKSTIDAIRTGRIYVYIQRFGAEDPDNPNSWTPVRYMSPFYGLTPTTSPNEGYGTFEGNSHSYGVWNSPPDIGTQVICIFIDGKSNYGYYIGCVPEPEALYMVPAMGASDNIVAGEGEAESFGGATRLPVVNINNNSPEAESSNFLNLAKPVHTYQSSIYFQQGLLRDPIRGPISSSAQRESPSRVGWGVSSPGRPIYGGGLSDEAAASSESSDSLRIIGRRGGHSIVLDDGDANGADQLMRLRTSLGHQIMMSDSGQTLFIIHSNGQSYIELGKEGTVDIYSTNSINLRTQGDLNLHADNNININAAKKFNLLAEEINIESQKDTNFRIGANFSEYTVGKFTLKVDGAMSLDSGGEASFKSSATTFINGSRINLNTGSAGLVPAVVKPIPQIAQTDTLYDSTKGYAAAPGKLMTIASRAPAHSPWANAGQGVDVKTDLSSGSQLPSSPSPAVAAANASVPAVPANPLSAKVAATVPSLPGAGPLNSATMGALVGQQSLTAAAGSAGAAVAAGNGVVQNALGQSTAAVGALAQSPQQLEAAGILKPGSASLVNNLVQNGTSVTNAMTNNLFTGKGGASSLTQLQNSIPAQVQAATGVITSATKGLITAGAITGKESPQVTAGIVNAASTVGLGPTIDFMKNAATGAAIGGLLSKSPLGAVAGAVAGAMSAGKFAGGLAASVTGGLGALAGSLGGLTKSVGAGLAGALDLTKGVAGAAFSAVTGAFKALTPGIPQNLTAIASASIAGATPSSLTSGLGGVGSALAGAAVGSLLSKNPLSALAGATIGTALGAGSAFGGAGSIVGSITGAANTVIAGIGKSVSTVVGSVTTLVTGAVSSVTSGLTGIPGGQGAISNIVNNMNNPLGVISGAIGGAVAGITGGIAGAVGSIGGMAKAALGGATDLLKKGGNTLAGLASSVLPAGLSNQINAAIGSIGSGGSVPIKIPTVAVNTFTPPSLDSLFGGGKSPVPNFNAVPMPVDQSAERERLKTAQIESLTTQIEDQNQQVIAARVAYTNAKISLPAEDPEVANLNAIWDIEIAKLKELQDQVSKLA